MEKTTMGDLEISFEDIICGVYVILLKKAGKNCISVRYQCPEKAKETPNRLLDYLFRTPTSMNEYPFKPFHWLFGKITKPRRNYVYV